MATNQPMLFYSSRCQHSKQILDTLQALNKTSLCRLIAIDGMTRDKLPGFLQKVPTLYVPETTDVFVGKDIFAYIAKPVSSRREVPVTAPTASPQQQANSQLPKGQTAQTPANLEAWSFSTAGGFSDGYASWDGKEATSDQLHYTFLGPMPGGGGPSGPLTVQSQDKDKYEKNEDTATRLKRMQDEREKEFASVERK
jgi:hypothetical protein